MPPRVGASGVGARGKLGTMNRTTSATLSAHGGAYEMAKSKTTTIRFAVGSPVGPKSAVWNVSFNTGKPNDIYLSPGPLMGNRKVSIHASGKRMYAFIDDEKAKEARMSGFPKETRRIECWEQPKTEVVPGFVHELTICVPTLYLSRSAKVTTDKGVIWVSPATGNGITLIMVYMPRVGLASKCARPRELAECISIGCGFIGYQHLEVPSLALMKSINDARQMVADASGNIKNPESWRAISAPTPLKGSDGPYVIYDLCPPL